VSPRPNFIVLLGERYGWRPLPEELPRALFERIRDALDSERRALLEWRDDQQEGSRGWYRLDSNALVGRAGGHDVERGVYVLQPRTARFTDSAVWARAVEEPLMEALSTSADRASAIGQSATEQEIRHGALAIPDARDHVLCFQRRIVDETGRPMRDVLAAAHGVQVPDALREMFDRTDSGELDLEAAGRVSRLQGDLRRHIGAGNVHEYDVVWRDGGLDRRWIDPFCEEVTQRLQAIIQIQIDAFVATGADPEGGTTHRAAGLERRRDFVGRAREREAIGRYRRGDGAKTPFAVVGPAGSGKSALLAWAAEETSRERREAVVIERYIGATVDSLLPSVLLGGLVAQIDRAYGRDPRSVSSDPFEAADAFAERLELAREDRPLALFIDGVDRLQVD
jgi:hypothetical protein